MFTGIVEDVGRVESVTTVPEGRRIRIGTAFPLQDLTKGASIAVDGACLTVVAAEETGAGGGSIFDVDVIGTTLSRTVAGRYEVGARVNLERARPLGSRLDGHWVQGHVDGLATLVGVRAEGNHHLMDMTLPPSVWQGTILHGSITLNGVSMTVNEMEGPDRCQVAVIPHTWDHTNLSGLEPGDPLNVEGDLIGKYVGRYLRSLNMQFDTVSERPEDGRDRGDET